MKIYSVQRGDSLFTIARKFYGDGYTYTQLAAYNDLDNPNAIAVGQKLRIPDMSDLERNLLDDWHNYGNGKILWRLTDQGVEIKGKGVVTSSKYTQKAEEIWEKYQQPLQTASKKYNVPIPVLIATISTESSGNTKAFRYEPLFYKRYIKGQKEWKSSPYYKSPRRISSSYGLMQIMYTTAYRVGFRGKPEDLYEPEACIDAGAAYIASAYQVKNHGWDPPKIACAYNAGSVRATTQNSWGMYHHPGHLDRWIPSYNSAIEVLSDVEAPESVTPPKEEAQTESPLATIRFIFPTEQGKEWKPVIVDLFPYSAQGLGNPVSFRINSVTRRDGGYSADIQNIAKGRYDFVFAEAESGSVLDDLTDIDIRESLSLVDLRSASRTTSRSAAPQDPAELGTLRIVFELDAPQQWKPLILDLFRYTESGGVLKPDTVTISTAPSAAQQGGVPAYDIPDVAYGMYSLDITDAATLELLQEVPDIQIRQPLVTYQYGTRLDAPSSSETSGIPSMAGKSFWQRLKLCWNLLWRE